MNELANLGINYSAQKRELPNHRNITPSISDIREYIYVFYL